MVLLSFYIGMFFHRILKFIQFRINSFYLNNIAYILLLGVHLSKNYLFLNLKILIKRANLTFIKLYKKLPQQMIKQLSKQVTEDLCAQQVITSICDCVKQLIDNAIDAQSTKIQIILQQYGKVMIRVKDNGCGIESFQFLAKKGSTSKNKGNYQEVNTLGFRGQALHSLGKVSRKMIITSTTASNITKQYDVKLQKQVNLSKTRQKGTTVQIQSLFEYLPVRRYQLLNKFKQFFKKIDQMIKQYCLIYHKISFVFKNIRDGKQDIILQTSPHDGANQQQNWLGRVEQLLGLKISSNLIYLKTQHLCGWILKNIQSGSSRQNTYIRKSLYYMYLNNRPINPLPKIIAILDQYYKKYNKSTKYIFILNIVLDWDNYDVNLTPNKRQIFIKENLVGMIIEELRSFIQKNVIQSIPILQDFSKSKQKLLTNYIKNDNIQQENIQDHIKPQQKSQLNKKQKDMPRTRIQQIKIQQKQAQNQNKVIINSKKQQIRPKIMQQNKSNDINLNKNKLIQSLNQRMSIGSKKPIISNFNSMSKQTKSHRNQTKIEEQQPKTLKTRQNPKQSTNNTFQIKKDKQPSLSENPSQNLLPQRTTHNISKQCFKQFKILGQFNHGFIVCYYDNDENRNYYLVDQHAASQKFHFQAFMKLTPNKSQVCDQIRINPIDMDYLQENKERLQQDGYKFQFESRDQVNLMQAPVFLDKIYGKQFFLQLISTKKRLTQIPDYYSAAATKACRTAVMVGDVLQNSQMKNIVSELSNLNSPWNCPHGRPTLIFLGHKQQIQKEIKPQRRQYSLF